MTRIHQHIRRAAAILAGLTGLAAALMASAATPALAAMMNPIPVGDSGGTAPLLTPTVTRTVVVGGTPGWQIALIAAGAALLAAVLAVLADRARAAHHKSALSAA
jgi:hypothetical protein